MDKTNVRKPEATFPKTKENGSINKTATITGAISVAIQRIGYFSASNAEKKIYVTKVAVKNAAAHSEETNTRVSTDVSKKKAAEKTINATPLFRSTCSPLP